MTKLKGSATNRVKQKQRAKKEDSNLTKINRFAIYRTGKIYKRVRNRVKSFEMSSFSKYTMCI